MNLREWLFTQRLSIKYFAGLMRVDRSYVHRWLKGTRLPSEDIMKRIREISLDSVFNPEDLKDVEKKRQKREEN
jgi:transcriptional regulator with XRE-family HTH domain